MEPGAVPRLCPPPSAARSPRSPSSHWLAVPLQVLTPGGDPKRLSLGEDVSRSVSWGEASMSPFISSGVPAPKPSLLPGSAPPPGSLCESEDE